MGSEQWLHEGVVVDWEKLLPPNEALWCCRAAGLWRDLLPGDLSQPKDEQGLREAMCERRSILVYAAAMSRLMLRRLACA